MIKEIEAFFEPQSIAVVGVSEDPGKLGSIIFNNLLDAGFKGGLYPVNPKHKELFWHKCYANISDIEDGVELVIIVVPAKIVPAVMRDAARKGVQSVIIVTAGFKETGEEGKKIEAEIIGIADQYGMRIIGPNCLGVIVPGNNLNASFAASTPEDGDIAFFSQSGAYCTAILDMAIPVNLGFSHFVSFGNKADVDEIDLLQALLPNKKVKVLGAYLEEIKLGQEFVETMMNSKVRKPLIILKAGQTEEAKIAAVSHTGAIAGSMQTYKTAFAQTGVIEANTLRDLFNMMMAFSWIKYPAGDRVGIITNAGGPGIVATDLVINGGLKMAELADETQKKLRSALPSTAGVHNPVDVVGDALADRYQVAVQALAEDENVDSILIIITPQLITQIEETAKIIINAIKVYNKPIIPVLLGEKYMAPAMSRFYDKKFAAYKDIKDAVDVLAAMVNFVKYQKYSYAEGISSGKKGLYRDEVLKHVGSWAALPDKITAKLCEEVGLSLPRQKLCTSIDQASEFAKDIFPVVIKASNTSIAHKTDFKAIHLDLQDDKDLRAAYTVLEQTISERTGVGREKVDILVQEQIKYEEQLFIGANRDGASDVYETGKPGFGHLLVFGQGGIYTEIQKDVGYALVPSDKEYIQSELEKTRIYRILIGARGKDKLAVDKYVNAICAVQKLVLLYPEIKSLDLNPILISKDRAVAVDVKIFL